MCVFRGGMFSDKDFVLIFQNSNAFNATYRFIEVVPYDNDVRNSNLCIQSAPMMHKYVYEKHNPCDVCIKAEDGYNYGLNIGAPCDKGHMNGSTKADWVNKAREGFLFDISQQYLYCHNGKMGFINLLLNKFTPFLSNEGVYVFFYRMMQLSDKPLPKLEFGKWESEIDEDDKSTVYDSDEYNDDDDGKDDEDDDEYETDYSD